MNSDVYIKKILEDLIKKYNNRKAKNIVTNKRVILKPTEVYRNYCKNNADIVKKESINEAVFQLKNKNFVTVDYLKFSDDVEKIYLNEDSLDSIYEYILDKFGIVSYDDILIQVKKIVDKYYYSGKIVQKYCEYVLEQMKSPTCLLTPKNIDDNLKMLQFLENNTEKLYIKEVSMLVYGKSKWFEENNYNEICTFLSNNLEVEHNKDEKDNDILSNFNVSTNEQEIYLKGNWIIQWENNILDVSKFSGGIAIGSGNIQEITNIIINSKSVMTIENKTSFQRINGNNMATMYLGGFANRHQIDFLRKVILYNPNVIYQHFGDIDIGGFLIHKHLCNETGTNFEMYCMGIQQLRDVRFNHCLQKLTSNDITRLNSLISDNTYTEILEYMLENNVKLEQEIVSYYIART